MVRQVSEHTTRYYWYPGEKAEWVRAGVAAGLGALTFALVGARFRVRGAAGGAAWRGGGVAAGAGREASVAPRRRRGPRRRRIG
jgi:hypothetical protein